MTSRRQFLKVGIASAAVLAGAGWLAFRHGNRVPAGGRLWLDERSATIVAALAPAVLEGMLPAEPAARDKAIRAVVEAFDRAVIGLVPAVQEEISQLFALLGLGAGRFVVAGVRSAWPEATLAEVSAFLARWRNSRFALLQAGYLALTQLVVAAWYGNSDSWERIAYPGPPLLESPPA